MVKGIDATSRNWIIVDSFRDSSDTKTTDLYANLSLAEDSDSTHTTVFDSNGFKFTSSSTYASINASGETFIYVAFA